MVTEQRRIPTGIEGLDEVLKGGFIPESTNLIRGGPGVGKTTLGIQFLIQGKKENEKSLLITLGESENNIRKNALLNNLDLEDIVILDLSPESDYFAEVESYDIFTPADVEREPTTSKIIQVIEKEEPKRIFLDAITQFKFLSTNEFQYRKQALSFLRYLKEKGTTVLFTTENSASTPDDDMQFQSDSIINMKREEDYLYLYVSKFRGSGSINGYHTYTISEGGIKLFPNVIPALKAKGIAKHQLSFGIKEIDAMFKGGLESGTISLITGPSGVGKTTLGMQLAFQTAKDGFNTTIFSFEEAVEMMLKRGDQINIPARKLLEDKNLSIRKIEPLIFSADEFANIVKDQVEENATSVVIIDSTSGYELSIRHTNTKEKLHALSKFLQQNGVTVILVHEVDSITSDFKISEERLSYLADNIVFLRYLEMNGEMRKAIGVLKKRLSDYEKTLREFEITSQGIKVGEPLLNLRGILSGMPEWIK